MRTGEIASWREQIMRDFGLDLPIGSGSGSSRGDPLVILTANPDDAVLTEMLLLRCVGKVFDKLWRVRARSVMDGQWRNLEQVRVETKQLTATQIITETVNHYFDVSALLANKEVSSHEARQVPGYFDRSTGIFFPYEIGWLHFDREVSNEPAHPGLGQTISYSAPQIAGSICLYSGNVGPFPDEFDPVFLAPEFDTSASDILGLSPDAKAAGDGMIASTESGTRYLRQDFEIGPEHSVLALTVARRRYLKTRVTWLAEPLFYDIGNEFIDTVFDLARDVRAH
jgi:hypothetical protein